MGELMGEYKEQTLFGFPVVITDAVPKGEILVGRFPTWREILEHGSFERALEAQKKQWAKITGLETEDSVSK
jgi:hypothetical protein